jgi:hypothetical protein
MGELPIYLGLTSRARESGCCSTFHPKKKFHSGEEESWCWRLAGVVGVWYILISRRRDEFSHSKVARRNLIFSSPFQTNRLQKSCCRLGFRRAGKSSKLNPLGSSIFDCVCRSYKLTQGSRLYTHTVQCELTLRRRAGGWWHPPLWCVRSWGRISTLTRTGRSQEPIRSRCAI